MSNAISIILPVYNVGQYLEQCLQSLIAQTHRNIEIICVDDASTDGSSTILKRYAELEPRIRIFKHVVNRGLSAARNTGISQVKTEWVIFVDSDDIVSNRLCERALFAAVETGADVTFFSYLTFIDGTRHQAVDALAQPQKCERAFLLSQPAFACTKLIRAALIKKEQIYFPEGLCFEDTLVHWQLVLQAAAVCWLDEKLIYYRQRRGSITSRSDWSRADSLRVYDRVRAWLLSVGLWHQYGKIFLTQEITNFSKTYFYYTTVNSKFEKRVIAECRKRMTAEHWELALRGTGLKYWMCDFIIAECRPMGVTASATQIVPVIRHAIRTLVRSCWYYLKNLVRNG